MLIVKHPFNDLREGLLVVIDHFTFFYMYISICLISCTCVTGSCDCCVLQKHGRHAQLGSPGCVVVFLMKLLSYAVMTCSLCGY